MHLHVHQVLQGQSLISLSQPFIASQVVSHAFRIIAVLIYRYQYAHSSDLFSLSLRMLLWHFHGTVSLRPHAFACPQTISSSNLVGCPPLSCAYRLLVVEPFSVRDLAADYPLSRHLGFDHMPSNHFFLLSQLSRLHIFHCYVVV